MKMNVQVQLKYYGELNILSQLINRLILAKLKIIGDMEKELWSIIKI